MLRSAREAELIIAAVREGFRRSVLDGKLGLGVNDWTTSCMRERGVCVSNRLGRRAFRSDDAIALDSVPIVHSNESLISRLLYDGTNLELRRVVSQ